MLNKIRRVFDAFVPQKGAATALPPIPEPKVPNKPVSQPSFSRRTRTTTADQRLATTDRRTANLDLLTLRNGTTTKSTVRELAKVSPDLSGSVWAYQRMVVTPGFMAVARTQGGVADTAATQALQALIARMNFLTDYAQGFNNIAGIHAVAESLALELRIEGACSMELVLDKARLPSRLQPIAVSQIEFYEDKNNLVYPIQRIGGEDRNLDTPAFFYEVMDQDLLTAYADSPMEAALASTLADAEFTQDVRRVIRRALHPRLDVKIETDAFRKTIPLDIAADSERLREYQNNFISGIQESVNGLEPDDALVHFDSVGFDYLNNGNVSLDKEYSTLQQMINAKQATGTKAPPAVLGHGSGSANIASTETMLFIKYCAGVQMKINSILSRALTLGMRLMGFDVYVQFQFDEINLRPTDELEAFKSMRQSRVLELLSIGMLSDEEASLMLTGKLPSGSKKLSGTFFKAGSTDPDQVAADAAAAKSNTGAVEQDLNPGTPKQPKGPALKQVK